MPNKPKTAKYVATVVFELGVDRSLTKKAIREYAEATLNARATWSTGAAELMGLVNYGKLAARVRSVDID